jgi:Rrf2 family nitric oxide-sensitive transcriptional repressor
VIAPVCSLKPVLNEALNSFLTTLDRYTLADLLAGGAQRKLSRVFTMIATSGQRV